MICDDEFRLGGCSHLPHGRCGLKFADIDREIIGEKSPSTRKVWIEIHSSVDVATRKKKSPSTRKVWIEIKYADTPATITAIVTFHTEGVD